MQLLHSTAAHPTILKCPRQKVAGIQSPGVTVCQRRQHQWRSRVSLAAATDDEMTSADVKELANFISAQPMEEEQRASFSGLANVLQVPLSTIKNMAYKKKAFANITPSELEDKIKIIARVVEVTEDKARQMVIIQPALCFDTDKQAETLKFGIQTICWELEASKEEVVDLILENQSVLHGRKLHLSVADIASLAMMREPKGRVV